MGKDGNPSEVFFLDKASLALCTDAGAVTQLVERATPGEEVVGSTSTVATRSLLVGSVSV